MKNANSRLLAAMAAAVLVGQVSVASAAVAPSDRLRITSANGVEFDCTVGERVPESLLTTGGGCGPGGGAVALLAPASVLKNRNADVLLFEDAAMTKISDRLQIRVIELGTNDNFLITFRSDGDAALLIPANNPLSDNVLRLVETGNLQEVTRGAFPFYPATREPFRVYVQSDLNPVPEPSSVLLFASGLAGFAGWGWIRRSARSRRNIIGNGGPAAAQRA